ncbi:hypothetical protein H8959_000046 [Pygathrix nigripes]
MTSILTILQDMAHGHGHEHGDHKMELPDCKQWKIEGTPVKTVQKKLAAGGLWDLLGCNEAWRYVGGFAEMFPLLSNILVLFSESSEKFGIDECQTKYGNANAWRYCTKVFDMLTVAALIDEQILCVHGGLSPDIKTLDQIRTIERNQEIPHKGAFCDLVWSDPEDVDTWAISPRGAGWLFGAKVTNEFVHINNLKLICRAHQLVHEGYKFMFDEKLVTVWSAPNYCYRCGNIASIMVFKDVNTREPKLFRAVPDSERVIPPRTTTPYFL